MNYTLHTLNNGLRIINVPMPHVASVTALVLIGAGSRYEEKNINGLSHFLEHMAFKGTKTRPTALAISSLIDGIGGEFNAFTSKDHTGYYIKAAAKNLPLLVDVLSDMLLNSKFDEAEIEKERGVIIEEINMYEDLPMRRVEEIYENLLYGDTKLGRDIAGRKEVIRSVTRQDFIDYVSRFYHPKNTIVAIAGGTDEKLKYSLLANGIVKSSKPVYLKDMADLYLGSWQDKPVVSPDLVSDLQKEPALMVKYKDTQQAHLCIGVRAYHSTHPARYKQSVLAAILGSGMSSRLFIEVREKRGLAYYVRSSNERYQEVGHFVTQAGVDVNRIDDAIKVIIDQFGKIRDEKVTEEELNKAKEYMKGRLTLELEDSRFPASLYASSLLLEKKIETPEEIMKKIDEVTIDDVRDVAIDIFKQNTLNLAIIGPYKEDERFRKLLSL